MGKGYFFFAFFISLATPVGGEDLDRLQRQLLLAKELLHRVEEGAEPCFTDSCQIQKAQALQAFTKKIRRLPLGRFFLPSADRSLEAAHLLLHYKYEFKVDQNFFPKTFEEWKGWWDRRSWHDIELRSQWFTVSLELDAILEAFQIYREISNGTNDKRKQILREAWQRGLPEVATKARECVILSDEAADANLRGATTLANFKSSQALRCYEEFSALNDDKLEGLYFRLLSALFPDRPREQAAAFLIVIDRWMQELGETELFTEPLVATLFEWNKEVRNALRDAQQFSELEMGVLGLRNFHSPVNRQWMAEREILIQETLDTVEESTKITIDMLAFFLLLESAEFFVGKSSFLRWSFSSATTFATDSPNHQISDSFLPTSVRSEQLKGGLRGAQESMQRKWMELMKSKEVLRNKIAELEEKIRHAKLLEEGNAQ